MTDDFEKAPWGSHDRERLGSKSDSICARRCPTPFPLLSRNVEHNRCNRYVRYVVRTVAEWSEAGTILERRSWNRGLEE